MTDPSAQFAARASGLRDGRAAPEEWTAACGEDVEAFAARSEGRERQVLAISADATPGQREAFEARRSAWLEHADVAAVVSVVAHGDDPRPWLAIDPPNPSAAETVPEGRVRSIAVDLAEAFWLIESAGDPTPRRGQIRLDPQTGTARVCWPVAPDREPRSDGVERIGAVAYELLTGNEPPTEGLPDWPGEDSPPRLWHTITSALADSSLDSCYELKRALLFGPAVSAPEQPAVDADEPEPPADSTARGLPEELSRRTAVGVLGMGALGVTGLFARGTGTANSDSEVESEGPPTASFEFDQGRTTMTVTHDGGDDIEAGRLAIHNTRISGTGTYHWTDFEGYDAETTVSEGDSIVVDRGVLSMWYVDVVWISADGETEKVLEERQIGEEDLYS